MTRAGVGECLTEMVDTVAQRANTVRYGHFQSPGANDREVSVVVFPRERWGEVKDALEEIFGALAEEWSQ